MCKLMNNVKVPNVVPNVKVPNVKVPNAGGGWKVKMYTVIAILLVIAILGGIAFGIYKAMTAMGVKPHSKQTKEQCSADIECISGMCRFNMCL